MGYLDELEAEGLISAELRTQIREAYAPLLDDFRLRERAGERFNLADLIAYQFLLDQLVDRNRERQGYLPSLVRRIPFERLYHDAPLQGIGGIHTNSQNESSERLRGEVQRCDIGELAGNTPDLGQLRAAESDSPPPSQTCAHCFTSPECEQLGCVFEELLNSIAARLDAIKAA